MAKQRTDRLNSLLREVISDVIRREVKHPGVSELLTVTRVDITRDLRYAKVYISVIGSDEQRDETLDALNDAAGYIAVQASKQIVIRYFPQLTFKWDRGLAEQYRVQELLDDIESKRGPEDNAAASDS